jgi:MerR HTH family regulatory protein
MTIQELARKCGLSQGRAENWSEAGLIMPVPGRRREFAEDQVERALVIKTLQAKGVELPRLAGKSLDFPNNERYIIFDGYQLHGCRDAAEAIAVVARARRACSAVDLAAIRTGLTP